MKSWKIAAVAALFVSGPASAHEIWLERDGTGPARLYLGEPNEPVPEGGDPEFPKLKTPRIVPAKAAAVPIVRRADHLELAVAGSGDVRVQDDSIFAPWQQEEGMQGGIFYARAGRSETSGSLDFEFVPVAPASQRFVLRFRGQSLPATRVTLIAPGYWQKMFTTDAKGEIEVPSQGGGRYLLSAAHTEKANSTLGGVAVSSLMHITTLTFAQ